MGHPLSLDLRERAVSAVDGGLSRRQAAVRFSVSAASVIRWCQRRTASGSVAPARQGGDHRSQRIEAEAEPADLWPLIAHLEQAAKEDQDFQRLRAIREYRKLHSSPTSTKQPPAD